MEGPPKLAPRMHSRVDQPSTAHPAKTTESDPQIDPQQCFPGSAPPEVPHPSLGRGPSQAQAPYPAPMRAGCRHVSCSFECLGRCARDPTAGEGANADTGGRLAGELASNFVANASARAQPSTQSGRRRSRRRQSCKSNCKRYTDCICGPAVWIVSATRHFPTSYAPYQLNVNPDTQLHFDHT